jgi:hypothetical protein
MNKHMIPSRAAPEQDRGQIPTPIEPIAVRIPEAMRLTGIRRSKLYELIASGDIETAKIGTCTLITVASLRQLIEKARR